MSAASDIIFRRRVARIAPLLSDGPAEKSAAAKLKALGNTIARGEAAAAGGLGRLIHRGEAPEKSAENLMKVFREMRDMISSKARENPKLEEALRDNILSWWDLPETVALRFQLGKKGMPLVAPYSGTGAGTTARPAMPPPDVLKQIGKRIHERSGHVGGGMLAGLGAAGAGVTSLLRGGGEGSGDVLAKGASIISGKKAKGAKPDAAKLPKANYSKKWDSRKGAPNRDKPGEGLLRKKLAHAQPGDPNFTPQGLNMDPPERSLPSRIGSGLGAAAGKAFDFAGDYPKTTGMIAGVPIGLYLASKFGGGDDEDDRPGFLRRTVLPLALGAAAGGIGTHYAKKHFGNNPLAGPSGPAQ